MEDKKKSQIIRFSEEDYSFMEDVKSARGTSIQQFVENAVKNEIIRIRMEVEMQNIKNS